MGEDTPQQRDEYARAIKKLLQIMDDGLKHGFFECRVTCELGQAKKRFLTINAGQSYRFTIPPEELMK